MEEKSLKILSIQMASVLGDKEANFHKVMDLIHKNIKKGTDIIILPEVWNVGWSPSEFENSAEDLENGETFEFLSEIAQTYNVNIIGGSFITKRGNKYFNTCPILDRDGELVATYDKMHLFSYYGCDEGKFVEAGRSPVIVELEGVKIGLTLCYDIRFPEIYRAYRKAGADLLVNMAAWPMKRAVHWEVLTKARAVENQTFMVALTQSGLIKGDEYNLGHSRIIDHNGEVISEIKSGEGAMFAEIKFEEMYEFRKKCSVLLDIHDAYEVQLKT
ncbi:MAG: carbon-nitrogen family hydrolase [bacterium]